MDNTTIVFAAIRSLSRLIPRKPPPQSPNLGQLYRESYNSFFSESFEEGPDLPVTRTTVRDVTPLELDMPEPAAQKAGVATACMSCARSHLAAVTGAWEEALRFAREKGVGDPEVVKRLAIAEKELTIMERVDLSPASIEASPREQQDMARRFLPTFRDLRQQAGEISTVRELEQAAALAENTGRQLRMDILASKGVDVKGIANLVKRVENKELTVDQAKEQLHNMVPRS